MEINSSRETIDMKLTSDWLSKLSFFALSRVNSERRKRGREKEKEAVLFIY